MKSEWKKLKIGDVCTIKHGYAFKGVHFCDEKTEYIVTTPGNFTISGGFKLDKPKYYRGPIPQDYILSPGDIIVTMTDLSKDGDTLGYAAIVPESDNAIFLHNQRIGLIENISDNIDKEFLYWIMRTYHYQKYIVNHASGSTVKHTSPSSIASYSFHAPSLPIQRKIASILSALDDKIETNNAICRNLEEQMESLFEKLFVREMNSEWKKGTISDLGKVIGGGTPSKKEPSYYTNNGIAWITPKDLSRCASKFVRKGEIDITRKGLEASSTTIMPEGTILFSSRAPIGYIAIAGGDVSTNQGFKSVVPYGCIGTPYVYYFLKHSTPVIENLASGSTFPEISASAMKQLPVVIPDAATLDKFNAFCEPRLNIQREKEGEISRLMELRDVLLPKLMNGEFNL